MGGKLEHGNRLCFVIMPFGATNTCTEDEWTRVFDDLFAPAIERLGYECRRSDATRGSLIKAIIQDLEMAWVVLADLTDQNPNVFYELGVRHALTDRTILVAQNRSFIPFDLRSYASHIYDWRSSEGRATFEVKIKELLEDVDRSPDRADNPVSDFLVTTKQPNRHQPLDTRLGEFERRMDALEVEQKFPRDGSGEKRAATALESIIDTSILGTDTASGDWFMAGVELAKSENEWELHRLDRRVREEIRTSIPGISAKLVVPNPPADRVKTSDIPTIAEQYELAFGPVASGLEQVALGLATVDWKAGARAILRISGALIDAGSALPGVKFATGLPAFLGWRMLLNCGAAAWVHGALDVAEVVLTEPLPIKQPGGRRTIRPLWQHGDLFYPTFVLGYADLGVKELLSQFERSLRLKEVFQSQQEYNTSLAQFLILVAMLNAREDEHPLYPGYRLVPEFRDACGTLITTVRSGRRALISRIFGVCEEKLESEWLRRATIANAAKLGGGYWFDEARIPTNLMAQEV